MEKAFDLIGYVRKKHPYIVEKMTDEQIKSNDDFVDCLIKSGYFIEKEQNQSIDISPQEYLEHVKVGGCLTEEGKQYVELRDALFAVNLAIIKKKRN